MPTYKIGRKQITTAPGVDNDDIKSASLKVSGSEQDVTVFKATPLTQIETMIGLVDITFEIVCTDTDAQRGDSGAFVIGGLDGSTMQLDAIVTEVKMGVTPKGMREYTVSYGMKAAPEA
jgi:hypothetical protein